MLSKKKSEPQGPLFFCSLGYEHTVIVTGDSHWDRYLGMTAASARFFVFKR